MRRTIWRLAALVLIAPQGAVAQGALTVDAGAVEACFAGWDGQGAPDCAGDASNECQRKNDVVATPDIVTCIAAETEVWDRLLNQTYRETRARFAERDRTEGNAALPIEDALVEAQRAWIAFRDAECALNYAAFQGGTIRSVVSASCALAMTARRTVQLRDVGRMEG